MRMKLERKQLFFDEPRPMKTNNALCIRVNVRMKKQFKFIFPCRDTRRVHLQIRVVYFLHFVSISKRGKECLIVSTNLIVGSSYYSFWLGEFC